MILDLCKHARVQVFSEVLALFPELVKLGNIKQHPSEDRDGGRFSWEKLFPSALCWCCGHTDFDPISSCFLLSCIEKHGCRGLYTLGVKICTHTHMTRVKLKLYKILRIKEEKNIREHLLLSITLSSNHLLQRRRDQ